MNINDIKTGRASEGGGHWYCSRTGACVYEIRSKSTGEMRPVDLRDARRLRLVPGFSSIAKMEYSAGLERWKIEQMAMAALTLPTRDGESVDEFMRRAYDDADEQARVARDRGTHLHGALQGYYEQKPVEAIDAPFVWPVITYLNERFPGVEWHAEKSFAHPLGYGGKSDLLSYDVPAVVDFKFKDFDEAYAAKALQKSRGRPGKGFGYDNHEMQLAAYEHGFGLSGAVRLNLFISSSVPKLIVPVEWPDNPNAFEAFKCLLRLWQLRKNYDSSFEREAA